MLRQDNKRKTLHFYVSILEFGFRYLHLDAAWIPFGGMRATRCKKVLGGVSALNRLIVRQLTLDSPALEDGILLPIGEDGSGVLVWLTHGRQVADLPAGAQVWSARGSQATFPCTICANVTARGVRGLPADAGDWLVDVSCSDPRLFQRKTSDEIFLQCDVLAELARRGHPPEVLNEQGQRFGLNYNPNGLLWDLQLRPFAGVTETWTYDGAHTLYGDGILNTELSQTLEVINDDTRKTFTELRALFEASWRTCSAFGHHHFSKALLGMITEKREDYFREHGRIPLQMTEVISLLPLVEFYTEHTDMERRRPLELARFCAGCRLSTQYWRCKRSSDIERDANRFAELATDYTAKRHAAAGADTTWQFKHHATHHLARQMVRDGGVLDCLAGERAHLRARAVSSPVRNTSVFEHTMLARMLASHLSRVKEEESFEDRLLGKTHELNMPGLGRVSAAQACVLCGTHLAEFDVFFVATSRDPMLIKACIEARGVGVALVVTRLLYGTDVNRVATLNHESAHTDVLRSSDINGVTLCRAWSVEADGSYVVVRAGSVY